MAAGATPDASDSSASRAELAPIRRPSWRPRSALARRAPADSTSSARRGSTATAFARQASAPAGTTTRRRRARTRLPRAGPSSPAGRPPWSGPHRPRSRRRVATCRGLQSGTWSDSPARAARGRAPLPGPDRSRAAQGSKQGRPGLHGRRCRLACGGESARISGGGAVARGGKRGYHTCTMNASYKHRPSPGLQRRSGRIETAAGRPPVGERGPSASRARSQTMAASAEPGTARHASVPPR